MDKDDLVHDMESVSPRSHEDNLPVSQQRILKFELQLYKLKDSQYLLDIQVSFFACYMQTEYSAHLPANGKRMVILVHPCIGLCKDED